MFTEAHILTPNQSTSHSYYFPCFVFGSSRVLFSPEPIFRCFPETIQENAVSHDRILPSLIIHSHPPIGKYMTYVVEKASLCKPRHNK